jgi:hypothetical protein
MDAIVGYTYRADFHCPDHVVEKLKTGPGEDFDGWALGEGVRMTPEENLDEIAVHFGIDRYDEYSFDTDYFPKVVFRDACDDEMQCSTCAVYLQEVEI